MKRQISIAWGLLILMFAAPVLAQETTSAKESTSSTTIIHNDRSTSRWRTSTGLTDFNIEMRGKIELTDNDKDIKSISDDGYLEINKTTFGSKRTIVIESEAGKIKKEYYEGRTKMNWEPAGREWMSEILPEIVRSTTIGAESRVARFFKQGGANAVLNEIGQIESDHVKSHYANLLMKQPVLLKNIQPSSTK
jgi:hypothetical protein